MIILPRIGSVFFAGGEKASDDELLQGRNLECDIAKGYGCALSFSACCRKAISKCCISWLRARSIGRCR
jgi:hypothetical protein